MSDNDMFEKVRSLMKNNIRAKDDSNAIHEYVKKKISYKEFFTNQTPSLQERYVNRIMNRLDKTPTDWEINFDLLTDEGKKLLLPRLKTFFKDVIMNINISEYKLQYNVNGEWHSYPLTSESLNKLIESFREKTC